MDCNTESFLLIATGLGAQSTPKMVQQVNFEVGLDEVLSSKRQNAFLVISGDKYTLVDQTSKIQLGTLVFDAGGWGAQGVGKTAFWGDNGILISTGFALMQANPITGSIDTFFNQIKYPEAIENFMPWPGDEKMVLIHTKTYPLKKDSTITHLSDNRDVNEYMGPANCKLYLYDAEKREIVATATTPHLITTFAPGLYNSNVVAGTYDGDVVQITPALEQTTLVHASDTTLHSILLCGNYIVTVPTMAHKLVGKNYGDKRVCFFRDGKRVREFVFDEEQPADKNSLLGASGNVFRMFYSPVQNSVVVNYGFSRLVNITLPGFDTLHHAIPYNMAKFYCLGSDNVRLLAAMDNAQNMFASAHMQGLYDLEGKKFLPAFKQQAAQDEYTRFYRTADKQGNYYVLGYTNSYSKSDVTVFSSNKTQPVRITCKGCNLLIDAENNMLSIESYGRLKAGELLFEKLWKSNYEIGFDKPTEILTQAFTTEMIPDGKQPFEVFDATKITNNAFALTGDKTVTVYDTLGNALVEVKNIEKLFSGKTLVVSPSKKYIAIANRGKRFNLSVWDIALNKKVYDLSLQKDVEINYFTFDKTLDVLWFSTQKINNGDITTDIYSVATDVAKPKEKFEFADSRFFSFAVDMAANRVAFEAYSKLYVATLNNRQIIWENTPLQNYYTVGQTKNGFTFSTGKEFHTLLHDSMYVYFTTYNNGRAIEVANSYLYKGDKSSVNNLAFVYKGKGYLPADYDVYFNRPDTVVQLAGSVNTEFNHLLSEAYRKRKRRAGNLSLDDLLTQSPQIQITNQSQLPYVVKENSISIEISAKSAYRNINRLHIVANGVPIFGRDGLPVSANKAITLSQKVLLKKGNNTLQVFVQDEAGIPSATETINIVAEYEAPSPKTYFVGIGIDKFKETGHDLSYSVKDIHDFAAALKNKLGSAIEIDTLFNQNVTVENIQALRTKLQQAGVNDKIIISYSGHGLLDKNFNYYLSTYLINFRNPAEGGLSYETLESLLDGLASREKLLLIDACHSGEVDREALDNMKVTFANPDIALKNGSKSGIDLLVDEEQTAGLKSSFELMQEIFTDVGRGTGTTVISAAAGTQVAFENGGLKNGIFTYCILQMLAEKPNCTVQELKSYVGTEVERRTNGLQKPTSRSETAGFDWQVW